MKEARYLLLHLARAVQESSSKNRVPNSKARIYYLGLDAIKALKERLSQDPHLLKNIFNSDEYISNDWKEIRQSLSPFGKDLNEEILNNINDKLTIQLHLELVGLYKKAIPCIKKLSGDIEKNYPSIEQEYGKLLKCVRSCKVLLNIEDFQNHILYEDIQYAFNKCITSFSQFILLHPDFDFQVEEEYSSLLPDITEQTIDYIILIGKQTKEPISKWEAKSYKEDREKPDFIKKYVDPKPILEKIITNQSAIKIFFGKEQYQKIISKTYEILMELYDTINDQENHLRIKSKKEMLDLSIR